MGLIVGAYFKLSYFLAPPKEPSMGAGYGMLFAMLFILISYLILLAIIQFLAYQSQSKIIAIIVLLLFPPTTGKYWMAYPYDLLTASGSDYHISIITT